MISSLYQYIKGKKALKSWLLLFHKVTQKVAITHLAIGIDSKLITML